MTHFISELFGLLDFPIKRVANAAAAILVVFAIAMPITFRHGLTAYANQTAARYERELSSLLKQLPPAVSDPRGPATPPDR